MNKSVLVAALLGASMAQAELYKWVDQYGNVQYSDSPPPQQQRQAAQVQQLDLVDQLEPLPALPSPSPIAREADRALRPLLMLYPSYEIDEQARVGSYLVGGDCVSPSRMTWIDVTERHEYFIPHVSSLAYRLKKVFAKHQWADKASVKTLSSAAKYPQYPWRLSAQIVALTLDACATDLPQPNAYRKAVDRSQLASYKYNRSRAYIKVRWTLQHLHQDVPITRMETEGVQGWLDKSGSGVARSIEQAFDQAGLQLLSDANFTTALYRLEGDQKASKKLKRLLPEDRLEGPTLSSRLAGMFGRQSDHHLQRLIRNLAPIRQRMATFYNRKGVMPVALEQLRYDLSSPYWRRLGAESIVLTDVGLEIELAADLFEQAGQLVVAPAEDYAYSAGWECRVQWSSETTAWQDLDYCHH